MPPLFLHGQPETQHKWLSRAALGTGGETFPESWLQDLLFTHPALIPLAEISSNVGEMVPVCRELAIPRSSGPVYLDIFGATADGRLVLIECKLWRNPQARREVIAQILEYASLMRSWTYSDLGEQVRKRTGSISTNPLYEAMSKVVGELDEALFVDRVTRALQTGDFLLIVAGDGIRSDVHAIADHLNRSSGLSASLALVEIQVWENGQGDQLVIPSVPVHSEIIKQRVLIDSKDVPLMIEEANETALSIERAIDPESALQRDHERAFWQSVINAADFDHADQDPPRHGGNGWIRIPLPPPLHAMTAFRTRDGRAGLFLRLKGPNGAATNAGLQPLLPAIEAEIGQGFTADPPGSEITSHDTSDSFEVTLRLPYPGDPWEDDAFRDWLVATSNRAVNALRPVLAQMRADR
ncbi:MAG: hypothetical protein ACE360_07465 [Hyphomicrobiales bacterium]